MKFPFFFLMFLCTLSSKAQKPECKDGTRIFYTDTLYPTLEQTSLCGVSGYYFANSPYALNQQKSDSLQKVLDKMNASNKSREFFYYMKVCYTNCSTEILKEYRWPKNNVYDETRSSMSGEQFRRSPLRSSNPSDFVKSLFSDIQ
jgi:hypothetical protein